jgi:hypothetical protein
MDKTPFPGTAAAKKLSSEVFKLVRVLHTTEIYSILNPRNVQHFSHGLDWRTHSGDEQAKEKSTMKKEEVEWAINYSDIVAHRLEILPQTIQSITKAMNEKVRAGLYSTVSESTERSGNVVDAKKAGSNTQAFLEMLQKIEFGVDESGKVSLPEIHLAPGNPIIEDLRRAGPAFEAEVERLITEKSAAALERERQRKSRFRS